MKPVKKSVPEVRRLAHFKVIHSLSFSHNFPFICPYDFPFELTLGSVFSCFSHLFTTSPVFFGFSCFVTTPVFSRSKRWHYKSWEAGVEKNRRSWKKIKNLREDRRSCENMGEAREDERSWKKTREAEKVGRSRRRCEKTGEAVFWEAVFWEDGF